MDKAWITVFSSKFFIINGRYSREIKWRAEIKKEKLSYLFNRLAKSLSESF